MTNKRIEVLNLDRAIQSARFWMSPTAPKGGGDFLATPPYMWAGEAVNWAWLQWQAEPDFGPISAALIDAVQHSLAPENRAEADRRGMRGELDWFVICCAILSGDAETARQAAADVKEAVFRRDYPTQAVARILSARIQGDVETERQQFEVSEQMGRESLPPPLPSRALLRSFVERDYTKLNKDVTKGAKKHWTERYLGKPSMPVLVTDELDRMVIDVAVKDVYSKWAHTEAVVAKLAIQDGAKITHDDFWFPLGLVSATRGSVSDR
jgi:hypothetical protein